MSDYTTGKGIWNGWSWRFVGLTVVVVAILQVILKYALKYPLVESLPLSVLITSYVIIPRVKERKLGNAVLGVLLMFVVSLVLELSIEWNSIIKPEFIQTNHTMSFITMSLLMPLLLGLVMAYAYLRLTQWSERKRGQVESSRRDKLAANNPTPVRRRVHHKKKRKR